MNVPPMILDLKVASPDRHPVHVWLPLFLLWPLILALGVVALVLTILADVVLFLLFLRHLLAFTVVEAEKKRCEMNE